jgi:hypothetical protein
MRRAWIAAALAVALGTVSFRAANAQDTASLLVPDRTAAAEVAKIVETTRSKGLPVDPILAKVRYAVLVAHASPPRIVAAAQAIAGRLEVARDALRPRDSATDIAAGEGALSYGVPKSVLMDMRRTSTEPSIAVPLGALAQLVASGVTVKRASEIVTSLIKRGATGQQLAVFSNDVNSDVGVGGRPDDALNVRMHMLSAALARPGAAAIPMGLGSTVSSDPRRPKP